MNLPEQITDEQIDAAWSFSTGGSIVTEDMRAFARKVAEEAVKQEREACAKLVTDMCAWTGGQGEPGTPGPSEIAAAIRART